MAYSHALEQGRFSLEGLNPLDGFRAMGRKVLDIISGLREGQQTRELGSAALDAMTVAASTGDSNTKASGTGGRNEGLSKTGQEFLDQQRRRGGTGDSKKEQ